MIPAPGLCWKVLVGRTVVPQVLYCHWKRATAALCRLTDLELGEHVMSESAVACPQSHTDHLVFSRKEVACCDVAGVISSTAPLSLWSLLPQREYKAMTIPPSILPVVDPNLVWQVHLLPWNLRCLTLGSCFLSISSFAFLPFVVLCFHCRTDPFTCTFHNQLPTVSYPKLECNNLYGVWKVYTKKLILIAPAGVVVVCWLFNIPAIC